MVSLACCNHLLLAIGKEKYIRDARVSWMLFVVCVFFLPNQPRNKKKVPSMAVSIIRMHWFSDQLWICMFSNINTWIEFRDHMTMDLFMNTVCG